MENNNEIQRNFEDFQQTIEEFEKKVDAFEEDMETVRYMESTLVNSLEFLKEKGLLDEFYSYSLQVADDEYRTMIINHFNKNKEAIE